jgi:hypothetical protein
MHQRVPKKYFYLGSNFLLKDLVRNVAIQARYLPSSGLLKKSEIKKTETMYTY